MSPKWLTANDNRPIFGIRDVTGSGKSSLTTSLSQHENDSSERHRPKLNHHRGLLLALLTSIADHVSNDRLNSNDAQPKPQPLYESFGRQMTLGQKRSALEWPYSNLQLAKATIELF